MNKKKATRNVVALMRRCTFCAEYKFTIESASCCALQGIGCIEKSACSQRIPYEQTVGMGARP